MTVDQFWPYKVFDGDHPLMEEWKKAKEILPGMGHIFNDFIQRVYRFPNNYGASVIKGGFFTSGDWEIVFLHFHLKSNKSYSMVSSPERFREWEEIQECLTLIKSWNKKEGELK